MKLVILFIITIVVVSGCTQEKQDTSIPPEPTNTDDIEIEKTDTEEATTENKTIEEVEITKPIEDTAKPAENIEKEEFQLIYPELTYQNAYTGPLYATSEQIGDSAPMDLHFENMDRNGVSFILAFFGIELEDIDFDLEYVTDSVKTHPHRIIPFFSPGMGSEETKPLVGDKLTKMYSETLKEIKKIAGEDFIKGFGEIEQYAWDIEPTDSRLVQLFGLANSNNLVVMFHPDPGQSGSVKQLIETYPETMFLIHMFPEDFDQDRQKYIEIIKSHDNLFFSIDADHMMYDGQTGLLYKYENLDTDTAKSKFISDFDSNYQTLLNTAVNRYKPLIEAAPDKVFWGTEMGLEYTYEPDVYDRTIKFSRLFIGKLKLEHQEKIGYKNALRVFGEGMVLN